MPRRPRPRSAWLWPGALLFCLALLPAQALHAHATGENYVWLNVGDGRLEGRFEIGAAELEKGFGLTLADNEAEARTQVDAARPRVEAYLRQHFEMSAGGRQIPLEFTGTDVTEAPGLGLFAQFFYRTAALEVPDEIEVRNEILLDTDRFHRSLLLIEFDRRSGKEYGEEFTALIFSRQNSEQILDLTDIRSLLRVRDFIWQGVLHIWIGIDHVLFLLALLLTAVLVWHRPGEEGGETARWEPTPDFRSALINIVKIVTTFTVAHSVTLSLAALDILRLNIQVVESIIALSIVLVALNNLRPVVKEGHWLVIFFFGLFHGVGFASVMGDLPFRMMHLVQVILAFNIGVELGQLAIVGAIFPVLFLLRRRAFYKPVFLYGGSIVIALISLWWFIERAFGL